MKLVINKIIGELIYRAHGDGQIDKAYGKILVKEPFELILDNDVENPNTVNVTPDGDLVVYTSTGDEQISSSLYVFLKGWRIEQFEQDIPVIEYEGFDSLFRKIRIQYGKYKSGVPVLLKQALYPDKDEIIDV